MAKKTDGPQMMDPSIIENKTPVAKANNPRVCWAIKTLNTEVWSLFPETPVEYSNVNGRNTALDVTYDLTGLDAGDIYDFVTLLRLIEDDERVAEVLTDKEEHVLVSMRPNPRTQDSRESFGLHQANLILSEFGSGEQEGFYEESDSLAEQDGDSA